MFQYFFSNSSPLGFVYLTSLSRSLLVSSFDKIHENGICREENGLGLFEVILGS